MIIIFSDHIYMEHLGGFIGFLLREIPWGFLGATLGRCLGEHI